jgi:translocator protein
MIKDTIRQIGVIITTVLMITGYALSHIIPNVVKSVSEVSNNFSVYFVPAPYTFSIWWIIFSGLIAYTVFQALPAQKESLALRKIGWWYIGGSISIMAWMYFWHSQRFAFMMLTMTGVLVSLLSIYEKLNIGMEKESLRMRYLVHMPFSIYLGWVTMSTIANISQFLAGSGWNGFGISPKIWTVVLIVLAILIAELTAFNRQDLAYLAVVVWSFIGIAVKNVGISPVFEAASVAAGFVIIMAVITIVVKPKLKPHD